MVNSFVKLLILCILVALLCSCKKQINNDKELIKNLSEQREEKSFLYSLLPTKNVIFKNETAVYTGVIANNADDDYFFIDINDSNFIFDSFSVLVVKNNTTAFDIYIKPNSTVEDCQVYFPTLSIKSENSGLYIVKDEVIPIFIYNNCSFRE